MPIYSTVSPAAPKPQDEVVDAEYVEVPPSSPQGYPQGVVNVGPQDSWIPVQEPVYVPSGTSPLSTAAPATQDVIERRARVVSMFIKIPFLAYVGLNDKAPPLVRAGCAALALWELIQLARDANEVQQTVTDWTGQ